MKKCSNPDIYIVSEKDNRMTAVLDFRNQGLLKMPVLQQVVEAGINLDGNQLTAVDYQKTLRHIQQVNFYFRR